MSSGPVGWYGGSSDRGFPRSRLHPPRGFFGQRRDGGVARWIDEEFGEISSGELQAPGLRRVLVAHNHDRVLRRCQSAFDDPHDAGRDLRYRFSHVIERRCVGQVSLDLTGKQPIEIVPPLTGPPGILSSFRQVRLDGGLESMVSCNRRGR